MLLCAFKVSMKIIKAPVFIGLQDAYLHQEKKNFFKALGTTFEDILHVDLQNYTDDEIYEAFGNALEMSEETFIELTQELDEFFIDNIINDELTNIYPDKRSN